MIGTSVNSLDHVVDTAAVPAEPTHLTTVSQSTSSITISWAEPFDGGSTITDYEVDWNQGSQTNSWTPLTSTTGGATSYTKSGLTVP